MGKKPVSVLKAKGYSIYCYLVRIPPGEKASLTKQQEQTFQRGVNIRATNGKHTLDIELYDKDLIRINATVETFSKDRITGGFSDDLVNSYNGRISDIKAKVRQYIDDNPKVDKPTLMEHVYGKGVEFKRKRTKYITIPVRNKYNQVVRSIDVTNKELDEVLRPYSSDGKKLDATNEYGELEIQSEDDIIELIETDRNEKYWNEERVKRKAEIDGMAPVDRYTKGEFDKTNIFEIVGQVLYLNKTKTKPFTKNWKQAVSKLFDYRSRTNPKESVKDFSIEWVNEVFTFFKENGYSTAHPHKFNVFKYDSEVFRKASTKKYTDVSLHKFIKNLKEVLQYLMEENKLPLINLKKITFADYSVSKLMQDTEKEFYLTKPEIDKLFKFNKFKATKYYSIKELEQARDLFILQFWFGGLRPKEELLLDGGVTIEPDGYGKRKVNYIISKDANITNENPICTYSDLVLKRYNYDFEKIKMDYVKYSRILKEIGMQVFDRKIIKYQQNDGKIKKIQTNVNVEFTSYFARRSFEQMLNVAGVNQADTASFTGRRLNLGSIKNYRHFTYEQKKKVMEKIKPA